MTATQEDLAAVASMLELIASDPITAADKLEEMGRGMLELAQRLRESPPAAGGTRDPGGMSDRVRMRVVGADGQIKQQIDTGA
jgi:hypothetical protein